MSIDPMVPFRPDVCRTDLPGSGDKHPIDRVGQVPPECTRRPLKPPNAPVEISENRDKQLRPRVYGSPGTGSNPLSSAQRHLHTKLRGAHQFLNQQAINPIKQR